MATDNVRLGVGTEFQVNTTTTGSQTNTNIVRNQNGSFVITWQSPDGGGDGIFGQRYNRAGQPQGAEFQVNSATSGNQRFPVVAIDSAGDFMIVWQSDGQDGSGYGIYGQRYDATGVTVGTETLINTTTTGSQRNANVAMDSAGDTVVTWASGSDQDGSGYGVYLRRYNASTTTWGSETRATQRPPTTKRMPPSRWIGRATSSSPGRTMTRPMD